MHILHLTHINPSNSSQQYNVHTKHRAFEIKMLNEQVRKKIEKRNSMYMNQ